MSDDTPRTMIDKAYKIGKRERETQGPRDEPLSGEWAGDYNVSDLLNEVEAGDDADFTAILDAYECGYQADDAIREDVEEDAR